MIVISTWESENIRQVLMQAKMKIKTIGLLGKKGEGAKPFVNLPLVKISQSTARIQEAHILIEYLICIMRLN